MRVLGLIPARGGSKGVPRKNIRLLCGKPLLQYTAEAALQARSLARVILSTEDEEIAEVGRRCGLDVPFMRPAQLAQDETPMLSVVQYVIRRLEEQRDMYDAVCLLQPTNPLRQAEDIEGCVELLQKSRASAVVSVLTVPPEYNPHWVYMRAADGVLRLSTGETTPITRRQALPDAFHREGSVYATLRDIIMEQNSLYGDQLVGYLMEQSRSVNIDGLHDWQRAEELIGAVSSQCAV